VWLLANQAGAAMNIMAVRWQKLYRGTPAEIALEPAIASIGVPYRNQFPLYLYGARYFLDFALPTLGLVVECDDPSHLKADKVIADAERTAEIESKFGWSVVRVTNENALTDPFGTIQSALREAGITPRDIELAKRKPLAGCMPKPGRAPQKARREARSVARRAARTP
jgi:very-short-patch-repair endonuclease